MPRYNYSIFSWHHLPFSSETRIILWNYTRELMWKAYQNMESIPKYGVIEPPLSQRKEAKMVTEAPYIHQGIYGHPIFIRSVSLGAYKYLLDYRQVTQSYRYWWIIWDLHTKLKKEHPRIFTKNSNDHQVMYYCIFHKFVIEGNSNRVPS